MNGEVPSEGTKEGLRTIPLLNSMVDVVIVFGFDETCSRELVILDEDEVSGQGKGGRGVRREGGERVGKGSERRGKGGRGEGGVREEGRE